MTHTGFDQNSWWQEIKLIYLQIMEIAARHQDNPENVEPLKSIYADYQSLKRKYEI